MVVLMRNPGSWRALLCLLLLPAFASPAQAGGYRFAAPRVNHYDPIILSVARSFSIEPALVKAVIAAESSFEPDAISRAGALGLMQLTPETAAELGARMGPARLEQWALSLILIYVVNVQSFGWTIQFHLPLGFLAQSTLLIAVTTALAGLYPARIAIRLTEGGEG